MNSDLLKPEHTSRIALRPCLNIMLLFPCCVCTLEKLMDSELVKLYLKFQDGL